MGVEREFAYCVQAFSSIPDLTWKLKKSDSAPCDSLDTVIFYLQGLDKPQQGFRFCPVYELKHCFLLVFLVDNLFEDYFCFFFC